ncbi:MAG: 4'-phosphopantetheinyl transferase superfamily protein [Ruminococcaceae bacterium]|nr:4'-phosphopantetheinyl transferase superfamily protein [Oscillospiraceae bacterium]
MKVYFVNITDVEENLFDIWYDRMDSIKKTSVLKMQSEHKRKLRIAADMLCRKGVSEFCGIAENEIAIGYTAAGKPYAEGLPVNFSISHSGDYAVCAVSGSEIGIDVEKIRTVHPRAHEKFCTESEARYVNGEENGFFKLWTLKEAYFKCTGTGLGADIKDVSFEINGSEITCSEKGYEFSFFPVNEDYICSICKKAEPFI